MTDDNVNRFCPQCGTPLQLEAAFCVACGAPTGRDRNNRRRAATNPTGSALRSLAPAIVISAIALVGGLAIGVGYMRQPPAREPLARGGAAPGTGGVAGGRLPSDHPPIEVPEEVRSVITRMEGLADEQPDNLDAWKQLAFVQYRAGQVEPVFLDKAGKSYRHILDRDARDLDALRGLGNIAYDRNDPIAAMDYYRRYLDVDPTDKSVRTDMATMLLAAQRPAEAVQAYQAVLQEDPTYFQAQFNLAIAYRAAGESELALAAMQRAREIANDDEARSRVDSILGALGSAPAAGGDRAPAQGSLRDAVEAVFRSHPIVGPRIDAIRWSDDQKAIVTLREFPIDGMPPMVRERFVERLTSGLAESKRRFSSSESIAVDIVDAASGETMLTVSN